MMSEEHASVKFCNAVANALMLDYFNLDFLAFFELIVPS
jgi:hypothetical protein